MTDLAYERPQESEGAEVNLTLTPSVAPEEILDVYPAAQSLRRIRHLAGPFPSVHPCIGADPRGLRKA
jgi:hypothetical protein